MINSRRSKLIFIITGIFIAAITCFFICPPGSFIHDTLPYILGAVGWAVLFMIFIKAGFWFSTNFIRIPLFLMVVPVVFYLFYYEGELK